MKGDTQMKWIEIGFGIITPPSFTMILVELAHSDTKHELSIGILNMIMVIQWNRRVSPDVEN